MNWIVLYTIMNNTITDVCFIFIKYFNTYYIKNLILLMLARSIETLFTIKIYGR